MGSKGKYLEKPESRHLHISKQEIQTYINDHYISRSSSNAFAILPLRASSYKELALSVTAILYIIVHM